MSSGLALFCEIIIAILLPPLGVCLKTGCCTVSFFSFHKSILFFSDELLICIFMSTESENSNSWPCRNVLQIAGRSVDMRGVDDIRIRSRDNIRALRYSLYASSHGSWPLHCGCLAPSRSSARVVVIINYSTCCSNVCVKSRIHAISVCVVFVWLSVIVFETIRMNFISQFTANSNQMTPFCYSCSPTSLSHQFYNTRRSRSVK